MRSLAFVLLLLISGAGVGCAAPRAEPAPSGAAPPARVAVPAAASAPSPAADAVDVAAINQPFRNLTDVQSWVGKFERESREIYAKRIEIADAVGLAPGMRIVDVGAGTGLFEPLFSLAVGPAGKVLAVDIAPLFVEHIRRRALAESTPNVVASLCSDSATDLPPRSADVAFVCDVYHHFEHPERNLASIRATLVPGGRFVVVDFEKEPGRASDFVMHHVRAPKATVRAEIEAAGFVFEREVNLLDENYVLLFRAPR